MQAGAPGQRTARTSPHCCADGQLKKPPPQARPPTSELTERGWAESHLEKRGPFAAGLWACGVSCWNMGCSNRAAGTAGGRVLVHVLG